MQQEEEQLNRIRRNMVKQQIESRGISNQRVLEAFMNVPRHNFMGGSGRTCEAYEDRPVPIGHGQTISQPYIVALMTDLCELSGDEKVLEVGTGSGYQTAVLAELSETVYTLECVEPLAKRSKKLLEDLGYSNIHFVTGDGYEGFPAAAPYDVIICTAAPPTLPSALVEQIAEDGIIVAPIGSGIQYLYKIRKEFGSVQKQKICPVAFVPMVPGGG
jgi:protein-L-isoaspartate(D-aspartate) O-methyltransferase